jgi:uncharacterized delta-60 repeat protein
LNTVAFGTAIVWLGLIVTTQAQMSYDFNQQVNAKVYTLATQPDGKILVGAISSPLRLLPNGAIDPAFNAIPNYGGFVYTLAVQDDENVLLIGNFSSLSGQPRTNIGRFLPNGSQDSSFQPVSLSFNFAVAAQPDGKNLVGGDFSGVGGQHSAGIGRLEVDGTLDKTFNASLNGTVFALAVQADGRILAGGWFTSQGQVSVTNLARLNSDGTVDTNFVPNGAVGGVNCLAGQADGKILVGTTVTGPNGPRTNFVRFSVDGTLDTNFNPQVAGGVLSVAVQADGKIIVGGAFSSLGGQPRKGLGRLNADGSLDTSFVPPDYKTVFSLGLQQDGALLVGGEQIVPGPQTNHYIGRLQNTGPATENLSWDGTTITWLRGGTAPEIWGAYFQASSNGILWTDLGKGTRIPGGWQLSGIVLTPGSYLRARGRESVGQFNQSSWFVQSVMQVQQPPRIITDDGNFGFRSNRFGFNYIGQPQQVAVVEGTTNLTSWTPLATNTFGATASYFSDSTTPIPARRSYRLRLMGP